MESYSTICYKGILGDKPFPKMLCESSINDLLEKEILIKRESSFLTGKNSESISFPLEFNNQLYGLNENLLFEMYEVLRFHMEAAMADYWYGGLDEILFKLESFLNIDDKVIFLKECYSKNFPSNKWFSVYSKKLFPDGEVNGVRSWKEWVLLNIENSPNLLRLYLTSKEEYFMNTVSKNRKIIEEEDGLVDFYDLLKDWTLYYEKEHILLTINSELEKLRGYNNNYDTGDDKLLKDLFENPENYDTVIKQLEYKTIIAKKNGCLTIVVPKKYSKRGKQSFICAIGMQLHNKGYLYKHHDGASITKALNNTFDGVSVNRANYHSLKVSPNFSEFLQFTNFIPFVNI